MIRSAAHRCRVISLARDVTAVSVEDAFCEAAGRIAALHPGPAADELFRRMTSARKYCASLRGRLLLMEIACPDLARPYAFYLLGTAEDVLWHGAPLRLFLFGLYRPEAIRSYVPASMVLDREVLTGGNIASWLAGRSWPGGPCSSGLSLRAED